MAFIFRHNDREVWRLPAESGTGADALQRRLNALWGEGLKLVGIDTDGELPKRPFDEEDTPASAIRIWGFHWRAGREPEQSRASTCICQSTARRQRRPKHGPARGYHTALMKGKYPVCCLFLEIGPGEVDVNIHPAKREVKFHREREVRRYVAEAVREGLHEFHTKARVDRVEVEDLRPEVVDTRSFGLVAEDVPITTAEQKPLDMGFANPPEPIRKEDAPPLVPQPSTINPEASPTPSSRRCSMCH